MKCYAFENIEYIYIFTLLLLHTQLNLKIKQCEENEN